MGEGAAAAAFVALSEHSAVKAMGLRLETGCEYMFGSDLIDDHGAGRIRMLGDQSKYFLLEFTTLSISGFHKNFFFQVFLSGRIPVLAHPERYDLKTPSAAGMFEYLVQNGSPVQCDLGSLAGRWGRAAADNARRLIDSGVVSVFATDTHCRENERDELEKAIGLLESHAGRDRALGYLDANPRRILAGLRPGEGPV
ncbi:MAG: CpsB/CapC family capsule biosynthesis tyrosine phosphatase [Myxococcota bacterium]|jgi:protein-tyrosine phosphatase